MARNRFWKFLFPPDSGRWVEILRAGLGLQITLYAWSLRPDWVYLFGTTRSGLVNRALAEAVLSGESWLTPRLGWPITLGGFAGLNETWALWLLWLALLGAGLSLLIGLGGRPAAIVAWFLYLATVKSGTLFAYGVDNFTVIGLFYLMIAPLPKSWTFNFKLKDRPAPSPERIGFHRRILQLHLCIVYFFSGISKSLGVDWWNGDSIWRSLTRPPFDVISPDVLLRFEGLFPLIGITVCVLETGYAVFIWPGKTRAVWLSAVLFMHISIGLTMGLYLFALIMIVLNLAAFGPEFFSGRAILSSRRLLAHEDSIETREAR